MCQYRYYYYGGCQHQETLLYSFCAAAADAPSRPPRAGTTDDAPSTPPQAGTMDQRSPGTSSPSPSSNSSVPTSLTSLTSLPEPRPDITSIFQHSSELHHLSKLSPTRQPDHTMSSLAAFSTSNLGGMLTGKHRNTAAQANTTASHEARRTEEERHTPVGHPRHEQSGSMQRSDGSWELLTSTDGSGNANTDIWEEPLKTNDGSHTQHHSASETVSMYESLSSEIEMLHNEVNLLKQADLKFEMQKKLSKSPYTRTKKKPSPSVSPRDSDSVRSKIPAPVQKSPAGPLLHVQENEQPSASPVSPSRVHEHGSKTSGKVIHRIKEGHNPPHTAINDAAIIRAVPGSALNHGVGDQQSTPCSPTSPSAEPSKGSPHFAQPTVAAVIRRETVRRDSALSLGKTTPDGSPTMSARTTVPRHPRRAALPGGWTNPTDHQSATKPTVDSLHAAVVPEEPIEQFDPGQEIAPAHAKQEPPLRKKTSSSYMSPTKATTLRTIATIGQENTKQISPRLSHTQPIPQIDTTMTPAKSLTSAESNMSDSGSEKIITEMSSKSPFAWTGARKPSRYVSPGRRSPAGVIPADLRRRMTVGVSVADVLAEHARSSALPMIKNTTKKRRESTGDLLNPIRARLNKLGLLSGSVPEGKAASPTLASTTTKSSHSHLPTGPRQLMESPKAFAESKPAFEPPHRRLLAAKNAAAMSAAPAPSPLGRDTFQATAPSLRATATEFTPMTKSPMSRPVVTPSSFTTPASMVHDWESALMFRDAEAWAACSPDDKRLIQAARHYQRTGGMVPYGRVASQKHWQNVMMQHIAAQTGPTMSYADVYGTGIIAGQKLKPYQISAMDGLHWTVQGMNGGEEPDFFDNGSPSPNHTPRAYDSSPRRNPMCSPNSWTIGADCNNRNTFGWTGGAGREIKFVGYGPDAERNPNTPVSFNFRGGNSRSCSSNRNEIGPRMIGEEGYDGLPQPPLAPRSKAQWAKLKEYKKVPCSEMEITHAVELLPVPGQAPLAGYCNECAFGSQ